MTDPQPTAPLTPEREPGSKAPLFIVIGIIISLGFVIGYYLMFKSVMSQKTDKLPIIRRVDRPVELVERSGKDVDLVTLRGKVLVAGYVFTRCPRGCPGVLAEMISLRKKFARVADKIQFISVSVDTEHDKPDVLAEYARTLKVEDNANWWFLTGEERHVARLMNSLIGFIPTREIPEAERMSPDDKFLHDMRLALLDQDGHVRGYYDVMSPDPDFAKASKETLEKDIQRLLDGEG